MSTPSLTTGNMQALQMACVERLDAAVDSGLAERHTFRTGEVGQEPAEILVDEFETESGVEIRRFGDLLLGVSVDFSELDDDSAQRVTEIDFFLDGTSAPTFIERVSGEWGMKSRSVPQAKQDEAAAEILRLVNLVV